MKATTPAPRNPVSPEVLRQYRWPAVPGHSGEPLWDGTAFRWPSGHREPLASYTEATSNWSEELTDLHEAEVGKGDHPIDLASRQLAMESIERHVLNNPGIVMDVGCSSGYFLHDARKRFPDLPLVGADYIASPLRKLATSLPHTPLVQFDLRTCPLPSYSLAGIVCLNVLEHIDEDEKALQQMHRILQPEGIVHVEVPAGPSCFDIYDEVLMHHRRYTMRSLLDKAQRAGFKVVSSTHLGALIFPAFYWVKRRNRRFMSLPPDQKTEKVRALMRGSRRSTSMKIALQLELHLGRYVRYFAGIRCITVLRK